VELPGSGDRSAGIGEEPIILESFDRRTLANMEAALERICNGRPDGADHELRSFIADSIVACARKGQTTLGALTEAGEAALARRAISDRKQA
jgi:hypothetical protein